jgi:hypothetical protein
MERRIYWENVPLRWRPFLELTLERYRLQARAPKVSGIHSFAGQKQMSKSFLKFGMAMLPYEMDDEPVLQNCLSLRGQQNYLEKLAQVSLNPDGLCWLDPPCGWWIWMSISVHKRSKKNPYGDTGHPMVVWHNTIAEFVADVIRTCDALGVHYVMEQPLTSVLPEFPPVEKALMATKAACIKFPLCKFGASSQKPMQFWGTAPWLQQLRAIAERIYVCPSGSKPEDFPAGPNIVFAAAPTQTLSFRGPEGQVTGQKQVMTRSAAYPPCFCDTIAFIHKVHLARLFAEAVAKIIGKRFPELRNNWFVLALLPFLAGISL